MIRNPECAIAVRASTIEVDVPLILARKASREGAEPGDAGDTRLATVYQKSEGGANRVDLCRTAIGHLGSTTCPATAFGVSLE